MIYMVELRYVGGDLADLICDMRMWLDRNLIKASEFHHTSAAPELAFRVAFDDEDHATAFAEAFHGWVESAGAQGEAHWTMPPSSARST